MSDDEGGEEYGDYEDIGVAPEGEAEDEAQLPKAEGEAETDVDADADEEPGLDEEAAGSDEEDEEGEEDAEGAEAEAEEALPGEPGGGLKAQPQRTRVDPILRASNKPRTVIIVPDDERVTDHRLHKSEAAQIIAIRAKEIATFATSFVDAPHLHDPVALAFKELYDRRTPLKWRRQVGMTPAGELIVEEWNVREMALPALQPPVPLGHGVAK